MDEIAELGRAEIAEAGAVLGRAFGDNPGYRAILSHLEQGDRHAAVVRVNTGLTQAAVRHQQADAVRRDGRVAAAALYYAPGEYPVSLRAKLWQASGCATTGPRGIRNFLVMDAASARWHLRGPHYYLFVLGVDPPYQGRGLGKVLLHRLNARADAAGLPCFLETDKESSVKLYRSVGYEVKEEFVLERLGGLRIWTMVRPQSASSTSEGPSVR